MWQNGAWGNVTWYSLATLYASPLMTISERGYTKHYFAEGERIASAIGGGGSPLIDPNTQLATILGQSLHIQENTNNFVRGYFLNHWLDNLPEHDELYFTNNWWQDARFEPIVSFFAMNSLDYNSWTEGTLKEALPVIFEYHYGVPREMFSETSTLRDMFEVLGSDYGIILFLPTSHLADWMGGNLRLLYPWFLSQNSTDEVFYFHSDHLGSGTLITDSDGYGYQNLAYLPFGEILLDIKHQSGSYDERHRFTGHYRDEETGFDYAKARYYDSRLGI
jgi:diadenosine tetraphosphatase ApaH/serine/threonine PP2A family protein phosphatase